jgi:alpha-galactosidase
VLVLAISCALLLAAACGSGGGAGDGGDAGAGTGGDGGADGSAGGGQATVEESENQIVLQNGLATVSFDKETGLADLAWDGAVRVRGAYAGVDLDGALGYVTSKSYPVHALESQRRLVDGNGSGLEVVVASTDPDRPTIRQVFSMYDGLPYLFVQAEVIGEASIASNWLGPLIVDASGAVIPPDGADPRLLDVPFDNDEWVRFDSRVLGASDFTGTSYELFALYESESRAALVIGSVTHDFWKTGLYYAWDAAGHRLRALNVFGGVATPDRASNAGATYGKDGTHDLARHGAMVGKTLRSPRVLVGAFDDFRAGLEAFGQANAVVTPPRRWDDGPPFGWLTWAAFGTNVTAARVTAASDFLHDQLQPRGFESGPPVIVIDAGLGEDPAPLVAHIHANGQRAGTYRVPFTYFASASDPDPLGRAFPGGGGALYRDVVLRDDAGVPIRRHGSAYVLDVTHPAVRAAMRAQMKSVVDGGFDYLKLDFLSDGALEGRHADPGIRSGIQAYNDAMKLLTGELPPDIFVSLSIAPLFPGGWGHARRVSCDVVSQLNDLMAPTYPHYGSTEYLLNSMTWGWWMSGTLYRFNDPDETTLVRFHGTSTDIPFEWARTRVTASVIAGTVFLDSTDYTSATGADRASRLLTNPAVNELARSGRAFRPLEGDTAYVRAPIPGSTAVNAGSQAADAFVLADGEGAYLALFNYDGSRQVTRTIDLRRAGLFRTLTYRVVDLWTGETSTAADSLSVSLAPGGAALLQLTPE